MNPILDAAEVLPESVDIVHVGDSGMGFSTEKVTNSKFQTINKTLKRKNQRLFIVRGNHDDPSYWPRSVGNIQLVEDYAKAEFKNGKVCLFIGGGISIDRCSRKEGVSYWKGEPTPSPTCDISDVDVVIAHDCPSWINHPSSTLRVNYPSFCRDDADLMKDAKAQRETMDDIYHKASPSTWIYGHYHNYDKNFETDCDFYCLNIYEMASFCWIDGKFKKTY
jgi:predicted phosphodiesterase